MGPCSPSNDQLLRSLAELRSIKFDYACQLQNRITRALRALDTPHHCCHVCGFQPIEGMQQFLKNQGTDVRCLQCKCPIGGPDLDAVREILEGVA